MAMSHGHQAERKQKTKLDTAEPVTPAERKQKTKLDTAEPSRMKLDTAGPVKLDTAEPVTPRSRDTECHLTAMTQW